MRTQEHVALKKIAGRWRTIRSGTIHTLAKNQAGTPVDGGGWTDRDKSVGERQCMHINEHIGRKNGRL